MTNAGAGGDRTVGAGSVEAVLDLVEASEPTIRALVAEPDRAARLRAEVAALGSATDGVLGGLPVAVKDLIHVDGLATRAGSTVPVEAMTGPQATVVDRLRAAGAVVLGKTVTTEFAFQEPGPTANPRAPTHTSGGSSSGSAAAVAAGYTPLALGTQTVDSIITPAAYCGVVGYKPTYGRVPVDGVIAFAPSADHVGLLGSDVATIRTGASVICDRWDPARVDRSPSVGVPSGPYLDRADAGALRSFGSTTARLAAAGWRVVELEALADIDAVVAAHRRLIAAEFADAQAEWFDAYGDRYRPRTAALVHEGRSVTAAERAGSRAVAVDLGPRLTSQLDDNRLDAWITPAATTTAPAGLDAIGPAVMGLPWTSAHLPAVTVPAGTGDHELPYGLQLVGRPEGDEALVEVALAAEAVLGPLGPARPVGGFTAVRADD